MILKIKSAQRKQIEKQDRLRQWHLWFAWLPMRLSESKVVWLQNVYRRKDWYGSFEYSIRNPLEVDNT